MSDGMYDHIVLTPDQMRAAEEAVFKAGASPTELMEAAGQAVAELVADAVGAPYQCEGEIVVLAGPGQNGGDGFVAARLLRDWGYDVRLILLGRLESLTGPAQKMAALWGGPYGPNDLGRIRDAAAVVDALFGIGLTRPLDGDGALLIESANQCEGVKVAVDVPSGLDARTGQPLGLCFKADFTVTFGYRKPGQLIAPGRFFCGGVDHIVAVDIGIGLDHMLDVGPNTYHNCPRLWGSAFPHAGPGTHKYDRGQVLVLGGREPTLGASRLASIAALRAGAGIVMLAAPRGTYAVQASALDDILVRGFEQEFGFVAMLGEKRLRAAVVGPGMGLGEQSLRLVQAALGHAIALVLDADALTLLTGRLDSLRGAKCTELVLTPHEGEFARLFPDIAADMEKDRQAAVRAAAKQAGAVVVLKGVSTLIAAPDGRLAINSNAPATLSVAGTGDVLAGIIGGLLGQGMPAFEAAAAGVWVHGAAASRLGRGMIASDLLHVIGAALP